MYDQLFAVSLSASAVIIVLLGFIAFFDKGYVVRWRYYAWLIIALRLLIPLNITLPQTSITIPIQPMHMVISEKQITIAPTQEITEEVNKENIHSEKVLPALEEGPSSIYISLEKIVFYIWIAGVCLFLIYTFTRYFLFWQQIKPYLRKTSFDCAKNVAKQLGVRRMPKIYFSCQILSPMLIGFLHPYILLPEADYEEEEFKMILTHELIHYKRKDVWYKLLMVFANALHWFNPFVYIMVRQANRDLEFSCDEILCKNKDILFRKKYAMYILNAMRRGKQIVLTAGISNEGK